jgi:hypothetical protein
MREGYGLSDLQPGLQQKHALTGEYSRLLPKRDQHLELSSSEEGSYPRGTLPPRALLIHESRRRHHRHWCWRLNSPLLDHLPHQRTLKVAAWMRDARVAAPPLILPTGSISCASVALFNVVLLNDLCLYRMMWGYIERWMRDKYKDI